MPFRPLTKHFPPCHRCSAPANKNCRNCSAVLCALHIDGGRCKSCDARLWGLARRQETSAKQDATGLFTILGFMGVLALPIMMGTPSALLFVFCYLFAMVALPLALLPGSSAKARFRAMADSKLSPAPRGLPPVTRKRVLPWWESAEAPQERYPTSRKSG